MTLQEAMVAHKKGESIDYRPAGGSTEWIKGPFLKSGELFDRSKVVGIMVVEDALQEGTEFRIRPTGSRIKIMAMQNGWNVDAEVAAEGFGRLVARAALQDVRERLQANAVGTAFVDAIEKDFCGFVLR